MALIVLQLPRHLLEHKDLWVNPRARVYTGTFFTLNKKLRRQLNEISQGHWYIRNRYPLRLRLVSGQSRSKGRHGKVNYTPMNPKYDGREVDIVFHDPRDATAFKLRWL